jgi:hypothetical protein
MEITMSDLTPLQPETVPAGATSDKAYSQPAIVYELTLETRAGSPLSGALLTDPLNLDPVQSD